MPRIAKGKNRWRLPGQLYGYVASRNGIATMFARGRKKSLGVEFVPANKEYALRKLQSWLSRDSTLPPMMLYEAITLYYRERISGAGNSIRSVWESIIAGYFPVDMPLSAKLIADRIAVAEREPIILKGGRMLKESRNRKVSTSARYRQVINRFMQWCVDREYLSELPAKYLPPIGRSDAKLPARWTEEDVAAIVAEIRKSNKELAVVIQFLAATGLRVMELERAKWEHIKDGVLTVLGKGTKTRKIRLRHIPFAVGGQVQMPEVATAIAALRAVSRKKDYICGLTYLQIRYGFKKAVKKLGLWWSRMTLDGREERRTIHSLRATVIYRLRNTYHLGNDPIDQLMGNSELVRRRHYDTEIEISDLIKHLLGQNVGKIDGQNNHDLPQIANEKRRNRA